MHRFENFQCAQLKVAQNSPKIIYNIKSSFKADYSWYIMVFFRVYRSLFSCWNVQKSSLSELNPQISEIFLQNHVENVSRIISPRGHSLFVDSGPKPCLVYVESVFV